ncbi:hypothetical protein OGATHE_005051 [Ogataea polymorpha]|uniref:Uncharacterized protein n=1 Tax=Ogataea polymorpha TaxID=460523 RepID=A0A9P8NX69_9ASCO|nr:hypothetical protein OGATHE_005051 [Ogataea polymorpha]
MVCVDWLCVSVTVSPVCTVVSYVLGVSGVLVVIQVEASVLDWLSGVEELEAVVTCGGAVDEVGRVCVELVLLSVIEVSVDCGVADDWWLETITTSGLDGGIVHIVHVVSVQGCVEELKLRLDVLTIDELLVLIGVERGVVDVDWLELLNVELGVDEVEVVALVLEVETGLEVLGTTLLEVKLVDSLVVENVELELVRKLELELGELELLVDEEVEVVVEELLLIVVECEQREQLVTTFRSTST